MGNSKKGNRYSIEFKKQVCEYSLDNNYADTAKKFGVHYNSIKDWRKALGYPNLGSGYRLGFGEEIQIEACKMYMSNPSMTKQEVCDIYNTSTYSLGQWLRKHGFSMKVAKRKPLPTKAERIAKNFKVLKTEHNRVVAEYAEFRKAVNDTSHYVINQVEALSKGVN